MARFSSLGGCLLVIVLSSTLFGDERLAGIACRSVHLHYPAPEGLVFANEVAIESSAAGTYFCVGGFDHGYLGLQEQDRGKKVVIFSVWDPGKQDDPKAVPEERRVKLVAKGEAVRIGRFGNEGTGGQSFLDLDWTPGATYRFLIAAKIVGERTEFAAFLRAPDDKAWRPIATFSTITGGKPLSGYYSFIEDFRRDRASTTKARRAFFGNGWVRTRDGQWIALTRARFTADGNPARTIDAGVAGDRFFLATGGETANTHVPLGQRFDRPPTGLTELP